MAPARAADANVIDPIAQARLHAMLRFATGITLALLIAEVMGWQFSFLPPVLLAVLLTSLPGSPPFKTGMVLVVVMAAAAFIAFALATLLRLSPHIMFGAIGLILFVTFMAIAKGKAKLPATLLLLCISTVPVIAIAYPTLADLLPIAMVRAMAVAMLILWCMHAVWPRLVPRTAPPAAATVEEPVKMALVGTAVVLPVMLIYLLYGLADALPVLVTTVLLVATFDPRQGGAQAIGMMLGNLVGGLIGFVAYLLLGIAPSLPNLAIMTFIMAMGFAIRIDKGGTGAAIAVLTCNSSLIIFSSAMAAGPTSSGIWLTRLIQFALACVFAVGMMILVWGPSKSPAGKGS